MPLYLYRCDRCGTEQEEIQKFDAPKEMRCADEKCEGTARRSISAGSFHLKGGGWAKDGYSSGEP